MKIPVLDRKYNVPNFFKEDFLGDNLKDIVTTKDYIYTAYGFLSYSSFVDIFTLKGSFIKRIDLRPHIRGEFLSLFPQKGKIVAYIHKYIK